MLLIISFFMTKSQAFGKALKKVRLKKKISQEDLSLLADLSRVYISELEFGRKSPSIDTIFKISKALNIKCSKMMDLTETELIG